MSARTFPDQGSAFLDELGQRLSEGLAEVRAYLASPEGRELRKRIAQVSIIAVPILFRMRFFRASPVGRVLGMVGGTAIVIKLAEALRDWDPEPEPEIEPL